MQNTFKTILSPYTRNGTSKKDGYAYNKSHMTVFRYFERIEKNMDMNKSNFTNPIQLKTSQSDMVNTVFFFLFLFLFLFLG